ncbi:hypothetical protein GIB67_010083 [Kingdonia uniflora]|uniref:Fanconi-associated nuclease n=1 Tax=Kingdonia uniflora TaxID=39325 RepID=A0A7J7PAK1_9MAGN|nr:hypothetical protein GIB67_010083 [Kingdonia uniflora]
MPKKQMQGEQLKVVEESTKLLMEFNKELTESNKMMSKQLEAMLTKLRARAMFDSRCATTEGSRGKDGFCPRVWHDAGHEAVQWHNTRQFNDTTRGTPIGMPLSSGVIGFGRFVGMHGTPMGTPQSTHGMVGTRIGMSLVKRGQGTSLISEGVRQGILGTGQGMPLSYTLQVTQSVEKLGGASHVQESLGNLVRADFRNHSPKIDWDKPLTFDESPEEKGISSIRRQELIASLLTSYEDGTCPSLPNMVLDRTGTCVRISSTAEFLFWRVQRLFFFNGEQDLSAFLMVDLGLVKYPSYNCIVSNQLIPDRSDLLAYEEAIEVAQLMDESLDENNTETTMRCIEISDVRISSSSGGVSQFSIPECVRTFLSIFSSSLVYSKVVTLGISFLERERRYEDSIRLLKRLLKRITSDGRRGYWTLRLSIDLEHIGRLNESLSVAEEGLLDLWVRAGAKLALQRRILRLGKPPRRWKIPSFSESVKRKIKEVHVLGRPLNCELGVKNRFYGEDGEQCGVEQLALQYYAAEGGGWQGVHTESGIWMTIFGLLMWDVIFSDVSDVFLTKFQTAPLDLGTDNFYIARKSLIESHLSKIHDGMAEEILITSWELHVGTSCRGVNWDRHPLSDLRAAVTCVGGPSLASLCRLLAQDYKSWSSGMPDLLLWRFFGEYKGGEAKLVEVKGPKDSLSEQQRAWLLLLMDIGFSTEICKVGSRST